eukprot:6140302-Prymnesium_polylepis.1
MELGCHYGLGYWDSGLWSELESKHNSRQSCTWTRAELCTNRVVFSVFERTYTKGSKYKDRPIAHRPSQSLSAPATVPPTPHGRVARPARTSTPHFPKSGHGRQNTGTNARCT